MFDHHKQLTARALFVGQRIELRALERGASLAEAPLMITAGAAGAAVLFRYGVVVLFQLNAIEEAAFIKALRAFVSDAFDEPVAETLALVIDSGPEGMGANGLRLQDFSLPRLQLVADSLAKSVVLEHYESNIAVSFDRIEPLANELQRFGRAGHKRRELMRHIGATLAVQAKMVGRVEVTEKPDLLWEYPEMQRLYLRLEDEYEIGERHAALERKLALVSHTAETLLGMLTNKRMLHVEWYIVILIVIEVVIMLYEVIALPH